jgi:hypothetical protein
LSKKLRQVCTYVQKEEQIIAILREASVSRDPTLPLEEEENGDVGDPTMQAEEEYNGDINEEENPEFNEDNPEPHCVFEMPDYARLLKLTFEERFLMLKKLCSSLLEMYEDEWSSIISKRVKRYCNSQLRHHNNRVASLSLSLVPKNMNGVIALTSRYGSFLTIGTRREAGVPTDNNGVVTDIGR